MGSFRIQVPKQDGVATRKQIDSSQWNDGVRQNWVGWIRESDREFGIEWSLVRVWEVFVCV